MVGEVYLGKLEAVLLGIQAAFVDIGTEKSAFLHASDLVRESAEEAEDDDDEDTEETEEAEEPANGAKANGARSNGRRPRKAAAPPIQDALKRGQEIMVQVWKAPIFPNRPRVTATIS